MGKPLDGTISTINYARNAPVAGATFSGLDDANVTVSGYPKENVTTPERSDKWKVGGFSALGQVAGNRGWARVTIDCERAVDPETLALISSNLKSGRVTLYGSDDADCSQNVIAYDLDLYDGGDSGVVVCYPNKRKVRVPDATLEMAKQALQPVNGISTGSYDMSSTNVNSAREYARAFPGYHTYGGSDFSADDIEHIRTPGNMYVYGSSPDLASTFAEGRWYSWLYWPDKVGGRLCFAKDGSLYPKTWPGSGRGQAAPGRPMGLAMPGPFAGYVLSQWPADTSPYVTESTEEQHGFITCQRSDGVNASTFASNNLNQSWKGSVTQCVLEQTFRLRKVTESGRWGIVGWSISTGSDEGLEYIRHATDPDLSYFNLRIWNTDQDSSSIQFVVPESRILDGNFHTVTVGYNFTSVGNAVYGIIFDGEDLASGTGTGGTGFIATAQEVGGNPLLPYSVGYWSSPSSATQSSSDYVDFAGAVTGVRVGNTSPGGFYNTFLDQWAVMENMDKQARLRYGIGTSSEDFKREFWSIDFDAVQDYGITGSELEVGGVWLGNRVDFSASDKGTNVSPDSRAIVKISGGGSVAATQRETSRLAKVSIHNLTASRANKISAGVSGGMSSEVLVDVLSGSGDDQLKDSASVYGYPDGAAVSSVGHGGTTSIRFQIKATQ